MVSTGLRPKPIPNPIKTGGVGFRAIIPSALATASSSFLGGRAIALAEPSADLGGPFLDLLTHRLDLAPDTPGPRPLVPTRRGRSHRCVVPNFP